MNEAGYRDSGARLAADLAAQGINDRRVLAAVERVPRHCFVPEHMSRWAYADRPLPIGKGQTISQPYIVALSLQALRLSPGDRALEVGTGSGYQAALLAELGVEVFTVERYEELAETARARLKELGYTQVHIRVGDGIKGWHEQAPFQGIVVSAAAPSVPHSLQEQLAPGGRLVIPTGDRWSQDLWLMERTDGEWRKSYLCPCAFVPLVGEGGWR
ncbi:MAG: protein-L-isoaspartate(D-aspartate) O-methyltransferase [Candidatus Bipolaricaulota bacterium]